MSDIVTNSEVEDVLSSIRVLVGENKSPQNVTAQLPANDRLVLTPQLRVSQHDVLRLEPEDAVAPAEEWYEFEEPPLPDTIKVENHTALDEFDLQKSDASEQAQSAVEATDPLAKRKDFVELSEKIAALETAIARTADQWEPDGTGNDAYSGTQSPAMQWQENVELDATGRPLHAADIPQTLEQRPIEAVEQAAEDILEEQVIDENMLRALVAEIVKSELQGELGERITRNVRKLVRREIHRALTAQSLD